MRYYRNAVLFILSCLWFTPCLYAQKEVDINNMRKKELRRLATEQLRTEDSLKQYISQLKNNIDIKNTTINKNKSIISNLKFTIDSVENISKEQLDNFNTLKKKANNIALLLEKSNKKNQLLNDNIDLLTNKYCTKLNIDIEKIDNEFKYLFNSNWIITDIGSRNEVSLFSNQRDFLNFDAKWFRLQRLDSLFLLISGEANRIDGVEMIEYINLENDTLIVGSFDPYRKGRVEWRLSFEEQASSDSEPNICRMSASYGNKNYFGWAQLYDNRELLTRANEFKWVLNQKLNNGYFGDDFKAKQCGDCDRLIPFSGTITHLNVYEFMPDITIRIKSGSLAGKNLTIRYEHVRDFYKSFSRSMKEVNIPWSVSDDIDLNLDVEGQLIEGVWEIGDNAGRLDKSKGYRFVHLDDR